MIVVFVLDVYFGYWRNKNGDSFFMENEKWVKLKLLNCFY